MSPTHSMPFSVHADPPSPTFQDVFDAALVEYTKQTETDLATHPLAVELENCNSADDLLLVLEKRAKAFREFGEGNKRWVKILEPTVHVLYMLSLAVSNGIGLVRLLQLASLGSISPDRQFIRLFRLHWQSLAALASSLWSVSPSVPFLYFSCDGKVYYQTAEKFRASDEALIDLFDCIGGFLKRLQSHQSFSPGITEITVRIMSELLSVFALATQQMKMGRFSEFLL
jgi:hypothetical protein